MLCHVTQRNIAYKSWSGKEAVGASNNSAIGNYCQRIKWLHMKLVKTKVISSHLCVFFMTHCSGKFFYNHEIYDIFIRQLWPLWAPSAKIVNGTINTQVLYVRGSFWQIMITVWNNYVALLLCSSACFDTWSLRVKCGVRLTQPERLLDKAEFSETHGPLLLKFHEIKTPCQITHLIYQFCWIRPLSSHRRPSGWLGCVRYRIFVYLIVWPILIWLL